MRIESRIDFFEADVQSLCLPDLRSDHELKAAVGKTGTGLTVGLNKHQWNLKPPSKEEIAEFPVADDDSLLIAFERPKVSLHLMDVVMGMEGEGSRVSGRPRKIGALVAGQDAASVDAVETRLVGLRLKQARPVTLSEKRRLGIIDLECIELLGARLDAYQIRDYVANKANGRSLR